MILVSSQTSEEVTLPSQAGVVKGPHPSKVPVQHLYLFRRIHSGIACHPFSRPVAPSASRWLCDTNINPNATIETLGHLNAGKWWSRKIGP